MRLIIHSLTQHTASYNSFRSNTPAGDPMPTETERQ